MYKKYIEGNKIMNGKMLFILIFFKVIWIFKIEIGTCYIVYKLYILYKICRYFIDDDKC